VRRHSERDLADAALFTGCARIGPAAGPMVVLVASEAPLIADHKSKQRGERARLLTAHKEAADLRRANRYAAHVRAAHVGPLKLRAGEIGALEVAVNKRRSPEIGAVEVCLAKLARLECHPGKVGVAERAVIEVAVDKANVLEPRFDELSPRHAAPAHDGSREGHAAPIDHRERGPLAHDIDPSHVRELAVVKDRSGDVDSVQPYRIASAASKRPAFDAAVFDDSA